MTLIPKESPLENCNQLRISLLDFFENLILKFELTGALKSLIRPDQFATKKILILTTMALVKRSQHNWLKWLDGDADFVRVLSFDSSKAFDTVPYDILSDKLKATGLNPYVIN